jgi:predicted nuclease of predicted toxin-antitoxin system
MKFLLDENLEHEVYHRLEDDGHDLLHVEISDRLAKGTSDDHLARLSREERWIVVTYDDDFRDDFSEDDYHAVLLLPDQTLPANEVADALHAISTYYQQDQLRGIMTVGRSWL